MKGEAKHRPQPIKHAAVDWTGETLVSKDYGDIYFSIRGGRAESTAVYLDGNDLEQRFSSCRSFVIGELGFGAALNFALTIELWDRCSKRDSTLFYCAYENSPVPKLEIEKALSSQSVSPEIIRPIILSLPPLVEGLHIIDLPQYRARLLLNYGAAHEKLQETKAVVDAWYLDGFAPDKNPSLWSEDVLGQVTALSNFGCTLATYSVAGEVRQKLSSAGWTINKVPGPSGKREVLRGNLSPGSLSPRNLSLGNHSYGAASSMASPPAKVAVIGAGLAGCGTAEAFKRRGADVVIFDSRGKAAQGASGNELGVILPYPSKVREERHRFYTAGFLHMTRLLARMRIPADGLLFSPPQERQGNFLSAYAEFYYPNDYAQILTPGEVSDLCGIAISTPKVFFPTAGEISFPALCAKLIENLQLTPRRIEDLAQFESDGFDAIVVAPGYELNLIPDPLNAFIYPLKGQVAHIAETEVSKDLKYALCGKGYVLPARNGYHLVGSTYERGSTTEELSSEGERALIETFKTVLELRESKSPIVVGGRAAIRAATHDRFPFAGRFTSYSEAVPPNCYYNIGHGSRGGVSALLCAELIAASAFNEPLPLEASLIESINPNRCKIVAA